MRTLNACFRVIRACDDVVYVIYGGHDAYAAAVGNGGCTVAVILRDVARGLILIDRAGDGVSRHEIELSVIESARHERAVLPRGGNELWGGGVGNVVVIYRRALPVTVSLKVCRVGIYTKAEAAHHDYENAVVKIYCARCTLAFIVRFNASDAAAVGSGGLVDVD